ncbi:hypothetical protein BRC81_11190 [Halobacteriales archaeon QS_1_68_20]|nr:MAG: hypothetical protein BRC81_11190 [Halobacteriales archaeon QS_1_68_20]
MPEIGYWVFNHNRHSVAGNTSGYELHDSYFGGKTYGHVIDVHDEGTRMAIYDNTVAVTERSDKDAQAGGVVLRGEPQEYCDIFRNWFYNPDPPKEPPTEAFRTEAIVQEGASTWAGVSW